MFTQKLFLKYLYYNIFSLFITFYHFINIYEIKFAHLYKISFVHQPDKKYTYDIMLLKKD